MTTIRRINTRDARFPLKPGEGTDSIHTDPVYSYAVTLLESDDGLVGTGLAFTLGDGNGEICRMIEEMALPLAGREIEALMGEFGVVFKSIADHPRWRWLGPHKGMVHLALASITNACFDLWAKARGLPLWRLLLDLSPQQVVDLLDLSYLEDVMTRDDVLALLAGNASGRPGREGILATGYPGYDTSIGWFGYSDEQIRTNVKAAVDAGFDAMKLKVGSAESQRDIRRAYMVREAAGDQARVMLDANQSWTLPQAIRISSGSGRHVPLLDRGAHPPR